MQNNPYKIKDRYRRVQGRFLCSISWWLLWQLSSEIKNKNYAWWRFYWFKNGCWLDQVFNRLFSSNDHLKNSDNWTSQCVLVIVLRINLFQSFESFQSIVEMTHLVAVISDKLQDIVRVSRCLGWKIYIPSVFGLSIHDVSSYQPLNVAFFSLVLLVSYQ